jgi:hypothetical protein
MCIHKYALYIGIHMCIYLYTHIYIYMCIVYTCLEYLPAWTGVPESHTNSSLCILASICVYTYIHIFIDICIIYIRSIYHLGPESLKVILISLSVYWHLYVYILIYTYLYIYVLSILGVSTTLDQSP